MSLASMRPARALFGLALFGVASEPLAAREFDVPDGDVAILIWAMNQANDEAVNPGPDVIKLADGGTYELLAVDNSHVGDNGLPVISSDIEIDGAGGATIRRHREQAPHFRILFVERTGKLTVRKVTFANGVATNGPFTTGGAIQNEGEARLEDVTVTNSTADKGGAIYNREQHGLVGNQGLLGIVGCSITNNGAELQGGAIYNEGGSVRIDGGGRPARPCEVRRNNATEGGAVANYEGGSFRVFSVSIRENTASWCAGLLNVSSTMLLGARAVVSENRALNYGGGVCNRVGREERDPAVLTLNGASIEGNTAMGDGGGIHNLSELVIYRGTIVSNRVETPAGWAPVEAHGGGIYSTGQADIRNATIYNNVAAGGTGRSRREEPGENGQPARGGGSSPMEPLTSAPLR